jgi:hypothetical protein
MMMSLLGARAEGCAAYRRAAVLTVQRGCPVDGPYSAAPGPAASRCVSVVVAAAAGSVR